MSCSWFVVRCNQRQVVSREDLAFLDGVIEMEVDKLATMRLAAQCDSFHSCVSLST